MRSMSMCTVLAAAALAIGSAEARSSEMPWAESFDAATRLAAERGTLVMIDFYTDW